MRCSLVLLALLLAGCGYVIRLAPPDIWWSDDAATAPNGIKRQPMVWR
jgi:hypothetical protein